jgi:hypothetical protein
MALVSRSLGYSEKYKGMISETYVIDRQGNELWVLNSPTISWFSDDTIAVEVERRPNGGSLYNFKDRDGKILCGSDLKGPGPFSEGFARVRIGLNYGYVDKSCALVIQPQFTSAEPFSEGLAAVAKGDLTGFIDRKGQWAIEPRFRWVDSFKNGYALILDGSRSGYVDRTGKVIWRPTK